MKTRIVFFDAERILLEVLRVRKNFDNGKDLGISECNNYLGWLYWKQHQNLKAENYFKAALNSSIRAAGTHSLAAASDMFQLGDFYKYQHQTEKALEMYKTGAEIKQTLLLSQH